MSLYNKIIEQQKLLDAWRQVYKNKPKEGVDSVTCEEFEKYKKNKIKELWNELSSQRYECMPVQLIPVYKGEKVRFISLYTMRDKVVQHSLAKELSLIFDPLFSNCCYAYRSGKSALNVSQMIHQYILNKNSGYVLREDINSFFDSVLHDILIRKLKRRIKEDDVIELILKILRTPSLEKNGELVEKKLGIYQGSTVAPVLSNVYLMNIDKKVEEETDFYIRYSDDILIFFRRSRRI